MQKWNVLIFLLLFFTGVSLIFNKPGLGVLEKFYNYQQTNSESNNLLDPQFFLSTNLVQDLILKAFPVNNEIKPFNNQPSWRIYKTTLYIFYILTWLSLLYLFKSQTFFNPTLAYFGSIPIMLATLGLSQNEIYAAPFFILSLTFLFRSKLFLSFILFLIAVSFNWSLCFFAPVFLKFAPLRGIRIKNLYKLVMFLLPTFSIIFFKTVMEGNFQVDGIGYQWLINQPLIYFLKDRSSESWIIATSIFILLFFSVSLIYFFKKISNIFLRNINYLIIVVSTVGLVGASIFSLNSIYPPFLLIFIVLYILTLRSLTTPLNKERFLRSLISVYLLYLLFSPLGSSGNILWIILLSVITFLLKDNSFNRINLILVNIVSFMILFTRYGLAGSTHVRGEYFVFFQYVFVSFFIVYALWYILSFLRTCNLSALSNSLINRYSLICKWGIVIAMVLVNLSLIVSDGSSDHVSWTQYALASIEQPNPFIAQTMVDQRYPPLATGIISLYANLWKILIGSSPDYTIAIKLSILTFYVLTVIFLFKFIRSVSKKETMLPLDKLIIILTTFALVVQTQGLADVNIQVIPTLLGSIYLLFKRKYLLSGILMGITLSIKWQPIILLPLFGATLFNLKEGFWVSLRRCLIFGIGLFPIPAVAWFLVVINPGGWEAFNRSTDYLLHGAAMLSGQALNMNWVATYILHIVDPVTHISLQDLDWLNRQIPTDNAPWFLQGYLFMICWAAIVISYWFFKKKNLPNFIAASTMIFFAHHQLNKSAYEKHIFYVVLFMLVYYLLRPKSENRKLLIIFDIMTVMNLAFFYGFVGAREINPLFFGFDLTVLFSLLYLLIFITVFKDYMKGKILN